MRYTRKILGTQTQTHVLLSVPFEERKKPTILDGQENRLKYNKHDYYLRIIHKKIYKSRTKKFE